MGWRTWTWFVWFKKWPSCGLVCEHCNAPSGVIKFGKFLDYLRIWSTILYGWSYLASCGHGYNRQHLKLVSVMSVFTVSLYVLCIKELVLFSSYTHAQAHQSVRIVKKCAVTSSICIFHACSCMFCISSWCEVGVISVAYLGIVGSCAATWNIVHTFLTHSVVNR